MKLTKRKGFNFFRSYFDVYNELDKPEDKLAFIDALLNRQFLGIKPDNLKGLVKFAYVSQVNSIDSQVKGFEDKTGVKLTPCQPPCQPPCVGGTEAPCLQVEVEEKVKEKEKVEDDRFYNIDDLIFLYKENEKIIKAVLMNGKKNNINNREHLFKRLNDFNIHLASIGEQSKRFKDYCSHFLSWNRKQPKSNNPMQNIAY